jgi:hypothetical protein
MPRDGAIIFDDLIGKLDVLHVACDIHTSHLGFQSIQKTPITHVSSGFIRGIPGKTDFAL